MLDRKTKDLRNKIYVKSLGAVFSLLLMITFGTIAHAQFRAAVQGVVADTAGGTVAGATVTLLNNETGNSQTTTTSGEGFYRFSQLAPGLYTITVEKANFKKQELTEVKVDAEQVQGVNVTLEAGGIAETVTVQAENVGLESEDANIRKTITTQDILSLPQIGRDPYELARLTPGVFGTGARSADGSGTLLPNTSGPGGSSNSIFATEDRQPISANGQRVSSNNYQIDGSSVNSQTWGGGAVITPSQESVKEVQITSSTYSAEDGRNSGAQIKVVSQNGTNQWHGSAFFKLNDPSLNAFNKFPRNVIQDAGPTRVEQKYKSYGGSFGGRIIKDRLFFFFTYEGLTNKTNNINQKPIYVETDSYRASVIAARSGSLSARILADPGIAPRIASVLTPSCADLNSDIRNGCRVVGNGLDVGSLTGASGQYVQFFNTGNAPVGGGFDGIADLQKVLVFNPSNFRGNQYNTRIDFNATDKDRLTFSSYFVPNNNNASDGGSQGRPMSDIVSKRLSYALGFIYARTISSTMLNEARFNVTRWGYDETKTNPNLNFGLPRIEIESINPEPTPGRVKLGAPYGSNTPGQINERQFEVRDTFTDVIGNHAVKIGGEYRRDLNSNSEVGFARPLFTFKGLWNFANSTPIFEQIVANPNGKPVNNNATFHTGDLGFFVQDDWKARSNLTLNMGLRWEYFSPITADKGVIGNLILGPTGGLTGAKISTQKNISNNNFKNFAPQLGFAYSPNWLGENKLVVRGGGGIGYDRLPNALLANARRNPPNGSIYTICCGTAGVAGGDGFGTPFVDGQIAYVASGDGTITGYPANPLIGGGLNPATGLPNNGNVEIYGTPRRLPDATVYRYSLEGEYQLPAKLVATLGYQGSQGRHFVRINPINITTLGTNPGVGAVYFASPDVNSNYNAMIARLQGRLARQLSFDMNYRFAKSLDTASFESPCACTNQSYPLDQRQERGPSDFDVRHSYVASATWEIPFFNNHKSLAGRLLGGFQISPIVTWNSGFPWTPRIRAGLQLPGTQGGFGDIRPTTYNGTQPGSNSNDNFLRPGGIFGAPGTTIFGVSTSSGNPFTNLPAIGRNTLRGPRYFDTDLAISKRFGLGGYGFLGDNANIDVRFNFFNVFNTLNLVPFNALTDSTRVENNNFGRATEALAGRTSEFQIRFSF